MMADPTRIIPKPVNVCFIFSVSQEILLSLLCYLSAKLWRDVQLIHALNDHADVMTEHLAQCFVDLRSRGLPPQPLAKLRLDHTESRLDVAAFVIVGEKLIPLEIVIEEHL